MSKYKTFSLLKLGCFNYPMRTISEFWLHFFGMLESSTTKLRSSVAPLADSVTPIKFYDIAELTPN